MALILSANTDHAVQIESLIRTKSFLRRFYLDVYSRYQRFITKLPPGGALLEIGSGGGFAKDVISDLISSDLEPYCGIDMQLNATAIPFERGSIRAILMLNCFHHICDVAQFLKECSRCVKPGGGVLIVDPHVGWISTIILKYFHHENFDPFATEWQFSSKDPRNDANGALAWIVFRRDLELFTALFPDLEMVSYRPHSPLSYWVSGGLKRWRLMPGKLYKPFSKFEDLACYFFPQLGCFVDVELRRKDEA